MSEQPKSIDVRLSRLERKVGDQLFRDYVAGGNGGQLIIVIPDLDMVVCINGGSYSDFRWCRWELDLLPQFIVPAAVLTH